MHSIATLSLAFMAALPAVLSQDIGYLVNGTTTETETLTETATVTDIRILTPSISVSLHDDTIDIEADNATIINEAPDLDFDRRNLNETSFVTKEDMAGLVGDKRPAEVRDMLDNNFKHTSDIVDITQDVLQPPWVNNSVDMAYMIMNLGYFLTNVENPPLINDLVSSLPKKEQEALQKRRDEVQKEYHEIDDGRYPTWHTDIDLVTITTMVPYTTTFYETAMSSEVKVTSGVPTIMSSEVVETYRVTTSFEAVFTQSFQRPNFREQNNESPNAGSAAANVPVAAMAGALGAAAFGIAML